MSVVRKIPTLDCMPEHAHPADLPADIDRVVQVLGNRVRVAALIALAEDGPATATQLAARLDVSRSLVQHHMTELERLGVVDVDPPRAEVEVRRRFFRTNVPALRSILGSLSALRAFAEN